jgi:hypothetical protein
MRCGTSGIDVADGASNIYVGGIEVTSWSTVTKSQTSWKNYSHNSAVSEFSNLNGKALTSLPGIVLHIQTHHKVSKTADNKWIGASRAYITLTYDSLYTQSAQGSTGVSASLSSSGTTVEGYYRGGTTTTYTATLSSGYGFDGWYTAASGGTRVSRNLSYSETCSSDRTLYARAFVVSVQGETGVTTSMSRGNDGYTFTFTATLNSDTKYGFKGWYTNSSGTGTPSSTDLSYTVALSSATTMYAKVFTVTASGSTGVSASLSRGNDGRTFTFNATLSNNYAIDGWYNGSTRLSRNLSYSVALSDSASYTVKAFSVSYSGDTGISVSASRGSNGYTYTFTGTFNDTTKIKSTLNKWTVNSTAQSSTSTTLSVDISQNTTVTATSYRTTLDDSSLQGATATIARVSNTSITLEITLQAGWDFDGWYIGSSKASSNTSYTVTVSASNTYVPKTIHHVYSINVYGDDHCNASYSAADHYYGTVVTITATPTDNEYKILGWYTDSAGTQLYSNDVQTTVTITGDVLMYAKSIRKNIFYIKQNGAWIPVTNVYIKKSGSWDAFSALEYEDVFEIWRLYMQNGANRTMFK